MFWIVYLSFVLCNFLLSDCDSKAEEIRAKRQVNTLPLVFPYGATYKLLIGLAMPVPNNDKINLAWAANFQYQYLQITNITALSQYYFIKTVSREEREANEKRLMDERLVFYKSLTELMNSYGINGYECMMRAICESAQYPVEEDGLIGEIVHVLLTPDYGRSVFNEPDSSWESDMSSFVDAAVMGRQMFSCPSMYSDCPEGQGLMELISSLKDP